MGVFDYAATPGHPVNTTPAALHQNTFDRLHILKQSALRGARHQMDWASQHGRYHTTLEINGYEIADYVFHVLCKEGFSTVMSAESGNINDERMSICVGWSNVECDPDKKYVLPLEDTSWMGIEEELCAYAVKKDYGCTVVCYKTDLSESVIDLTVTAKDIEEAPEWVKAIEPVEVSFK